MREERRNSKQICDAYVLAKEISLASDKTDSKYFDPQWLYERVVALPEPPDEKERRAAARALVKAGHAALTALRPDLACEIFEKAFLLVSESKSGMVRSKAIAGVVLSWKKMGKPEAGERFVSRVLQGIELNKGEKARAKQERQLQDASIRAEQIKLPTLIKSPTGELVRKRPKRRAHASTALKQLD